MIKRAWVCKCDHPWCQERRIGYIDSQKVAVEILVGMGWSLEKFARTVYCYCPEHTKERENKETQ